MSVHRQLLGLTGALIASVCLAVPASTANTSGRVTGKQAALKGVTATGSGAPEQTVSRLIVKLRNPSASELARPMSASRMQALAATAGVGMKSVRAMAGNAALLALDTPLPLSEARAVAARLARDSAVEYAEPDIMLKKLVTPNDTRFFDWQWNLLRRLRLTPVPSFRMAAAHYPRWQPVARIFRSHGMQRPAIAALCWR